jgi:NitT/TauT family transport system substrate-binding protein
MRQTPEEFMLTRRTALAGLAGASLAPFSASHLHAQAAQQVTVTHWGVLLYGAPYAVAIDEGFYRAEGLNIDGVLTSKGGGTTMRNVMASSLPYGEVSLAAAISAMNQGLDVRVIHGGARTAGEILWAVPPNSDIRTPRDLNGRRVAFTSPRSVTEMLLIMVEEKYGIRVERVATGGIGAGLTMMAQGGVVAAPIMDPVRAQRQNNLRALFWVKDELPPMMQTVGVTTSEYARANRDTLRRLIAARRKGVEFVMRNPERTADIVAQHYEINRTIALTSINNLRAMNYWSAGDLEMDGMNNMVRGLQIVGEITGPIDWSRIVDQQFLS